MRLLENEKSGQNHNASILGEDANDITSLQLFKDKSKKWLKFVAQVVVFIFGIYNVLYFIQSSKAIHLV